VRQAVWFGHAADAPAEGASVDVAFRVARDTSPFHGSGAVELGVIDLRPTTVALPRTMAGAAAA